MLAKDGKLYTYLNAIYTKFNTVREKKSIRYGLPFIVLIVGGSFGLREWTSIRYEAARVKSVSREEAARMGLNKTKEVTLEDTYEEIQKIDIDNWENKRGPRPWEMVEQQQQQNATK